MRILLLTTHLNLGGIAVYVSSLAKGLVRKGHRVIVVSSGGDLVSTLAAGGVTHITVDLQTKSELHPKLLAAFVQLGAIIRQNKIEVLHAHTRVTQVLAQVLSRKLTVAYVATCHGFFKPRLWRKLWPCWGERSIAISQAVEEHLINDFRIPKDRVVIVHNGVEIEKFSAQRYNRQQKDTSKSELGLRPDAPVIGSIGRLSSVKGQRYLLLALPRILAEFPRAQLLLVGDGPERKPLQELVKELGIGQNVIFSPATPDTSKALACIDVFVLPSLMEGLGLAIIEAQAMGLAVVASKVGGIGSLIKDGENGLLVKPRDPLALAQAILRLLHDNALAATLGRAAAQQAREKFTLAQMVDGIERVYQEIGKGPQC
ncbi:MAG: glycosyltransferase family 4 protein [Candidatus Omnitrophota bacterium]